MIEVINKNNKVELVNKLNKLDVLEINPTIDIYKSGLSYEGGTPNTDCECDVVYLKGFEGDKPNTPTPNDTLIYQRHYIEAGYKVTVLASLDEFGNELILRTIKVML